MLAHDLLELLFRVPRGGRIFLRKEFSGLAALLRPAAGIYRRTIIPATRLVAVAGSLGKTTTRRALHAALCCPERGFLPHNYGVALAANVLRIRPRDTHAVIETGVGAPGYMEGYARMLRPDIVVMTSIKYEHYRSFSSLDDARREKVRLVAALDSSGIAILNGDDPLVRGMAAETRARVITYGIGEDNDVRATNIRGSDEGTAFDVLIEGARHEVRTRFLGTHMVYPFLAALTAAKLENVPVDAAISPLSELRPDGSRMELLHLSKGITILDDSFKNGIDSVDASLDAFDALSARRKIVVLGPITDPPGKRRDFHRRIGRRLRDCSDMVIGVGGGDMKALRAGCMSAGMPAEAVHLPGSRIEPTIALLERELRPGDAVLFKGRYSQRMRRIVLHLLGRRVTCRVSECFVKVPACDECPLLAAPPGLFRNRFIARFIRE